MKNEEAPIAALLNVLIPGDDSWPSAADAIIDHAGAFASFDADARARIDALAAALPGESRDARAAAAAAFESAEPALFRRLIEAVSEAYYSSPQAHARIAALSESGPRESETHFDESQLDRVRATRAGARD
jgi:hypothetical protein